MFSLADIMFVNADTLSSLQIIQSESHPNSHMQGPNKSTSGSKESLSVFGLFYHLASTPQGRQQLRKMFLRPSIDMSVIEERLRTIGTLVNVENQPLLEDLRKSLKRVKDIRTVVIHLQKGACGSSGRATAIKKGVWGSILSFSFHSLKILEALRGLAGNKTSIASKVRITIASELQKLIQHLSFSLKPAIMSFLALVKSLPRRSILRDRPNNTVSRFDKAWTPSWMQ